MTRHLLVAGACVLALAACSRGKPAQQAVQPNYNTDLPMAELMGHVVDPAAWTYWHGSGTEVTEAGEKDLSPTTEEGWTELENGAATLIEAGNLLQIPSRVRAPVDDWNRYAQELTTRAIAAKAAAANHDKQGVFDEGGRVYEVCTSCHKQFVIEPELKAEGGAPVGKLPALPKNLQKAPSKP